MRPERNNDCDRLEQEIGGETYIPLLRELQGADGSPTRFGSWTDVVAFMRAGTSDDPLKNSLLHAIFSAQARHPDPRWRTILLVIFWPGLASLCRRRASWDRDARNRWQNIVWAFLQTVSGIHKSSRSDRYVQRVINGTLHRFHDECQRAWKRAAMEVSTPVEQVEVLLPGAAGLDLDRIDAKLRWEAKVESYRRHLESGRITKADFHLLVQTRVNGKTAAQYARDIGVSRSCIRRRRARAEAAIGRTASSSRIHVPRDGPSPAF